MRLFDYDPCDKGTCAKIAGNQKKSLVSRARNQFAPGDIEESAFSDEMYKSSLNMSMGSKKERRSWAERQVSRSVGQHDDKALSLRKPPVAENTQKAIMQKGAFSCMGLW